MSFLSNIVKQVAPIVATFSPDPVTKAIATGATIQYQKQEESYQRKLAEERQREGKKRMAEIFGTGSVSSVQPMVRPTTTQQAGMGGFFGGVSDFFRGAGEVVSSAFGSGLPQLFGVGRPRGVGQQPAITTVTNVGAQESQGSGSIQAGFGSLVPSLVSGARSLITSPVGQIGLGTAVGGALSLIDSMGKQVRITRKTKRLAQQAYQLSFGDLSSATQLFASLTGISVNEMQFVQILTKRFRNDGPVITKAAVRKTRSTLRKMKSMCDMYNSVAKAPARRRATPMRRATTTLIKN